MADRGNLLHLPQPLHSEPPDRWGIALCKLRSAQIFFFRACLRCYPICIILIVNRMLKQRRQHVQITNSAVSRHILFLANSPRNISDEKSASQRTYGTLINPTQAMEIFASDWNCLFWIIKLYKNIRPDKTNNLGCGYEFWFRIESNKCGFVVFQEKPTCPSSTTTPTAHCGSTSLASTASNSSGLKWIPVRSTASWPIDLVSNRWVRLVAY